MKNEWILPTHLICGYFDCSMFGDLKISPERKRTLFEIEYYLEDGKTTFSNGIAYPIRRDFVRISSPGEVGNSLLPFKTKYVKFNAEGRLAEVLDKAPRYFRVHRTFEAQVLLDEILSLYTSPKPNEMLLYGKLLTLISLFLDDAKQPPDTDSFKRTAVLHAKEFIKKHYGEPIRLCDIAKEVNLSPNYFHTLFSEVTGISPHDYLVEHRIRIAKELLSTTPIPLSEIAERCGFGNQQYLTTVFKKRVGISPKTYRINASEDYLI